MANESAWAAVVVAGLAVVAGPVLATWSVRRQANTNERRAVYAEVLYLLRLRQEEVQARAIGWSTPDGEPSEREVKSAIARLTIYASPDVWKRTQSYMHNYGLGTLPAMQAAAASSSGGDNFPARLKLSDLAQTLDRDLDAITDEMRKDLGIRAFYVRDRKS